MLSIRRGENIRKRNDGRWEARYIINRDMYGKAIYKSVYAHSYKEVKQKLKQLNAKEKIPEDKISIEHVCLEWLSNVRISVKSSTFSNYHTVVYKHIIPRIGKHNLQLFTPVILNQFINELSQKGRLDGKGGLSPKTIKDIYSIVELILSYGIKQGYLNHFDFHNIMLPKVESKKVNVLNEREYHTLTTHLITHADIENVGTLLSLYTGIRLGELCALTWSDIDFEYGVLTINKTLQRIKNLDSDELQKTKIIITQPKSQNSIRKIPLQKFLLQILKEIKAKYKCKENTFLLTGSKRHIEPRLYENKFKKHLKSVEVKETNFHTLRHTFATKAVEQGMDIKTISELLGHSTVKFTLDRYVHSSLEQKRMGMEKLISF